MKKAGEQMSERIRLEHIDKRFFTQEGEMLVLQNIDLSLRQGEICAILGPSGSGKSTILNIIAQLIEPSAGKVILHGRLGYMFQKDQLLSWRTIWDNVLIGLEIQKKLTKENKARVEELLKTYDLWEFRNYYPRELSGGMRQRAALIRTLATNPDILLLDEPFSALDYQTRLMVSDDIYRILKKEGKEAILVTHDISEAISMADILYVLSSRPASIKSVHEIKLTLSEERTPLASRKAPEFKEYFNQIWKELDAHE